MNQVDVWALGEDIPVRGNSQFQGPEVAGELTCSRICKMPGWSWQGAQLVGASSHMPKNFRFDSWAGHAYTWVVGLIPSQGTYKTQTINVSLSHLSFFLSLKSIIKHILR